ncbi:Afadin [Cyphomyrmex costatus]|uniref:Afadin n=1 Tax=Cyphomyrmex costatus TaxID=456900 RepID=A0A195C1K9_9HYME|nr:Afadin [Cyphomyrmex costatus]
MATELANKKAERDALRGVIQQWNANRLDLFELSEPNEDLEFHGVMRFYFQDSGQKVATKCIRVASDATSQAVIETLIEKFRPDMRMLSVPEYALYEIHENGDERKLDLEEKPLLVQLNWHMDDREGRFLLKRIDDKTNAQGVGFTSEGSSFRRKLSKREKKQIKKQEKLSRLKSLEQDENAVPGDQNGVAEKLYTELPETSFTRSISNPEAVMRRRRQQKLERRLQQFRSKDGGPDTGGTLKIYGEALCKDVPYKTLLLSVRDSAAQVVREMLSKYGLEKVDPQLYCLVQVNSENVSGNSHQEYILDDDECPLAILMNHPSTRGSIMFHVRRRPADYMPRKRKKKPAGKWNELDHKYEDERLPFLLELNPDGSDIPNGAGVRHRLQPNVTEVGSERPIGPQAVQAQTLMLPGPTVMPRHCVIAFTENIVTLTPCSRDAHTYVNNQRIHQTTILQNGAIIKFGRMHTFRFIDPAPEERIRQRHDSNKQIDYAYDRRSPDATSQDVSSEKFHPGSGTPNGGGQIPGQAQERVAPSSPSKSAVAAVRSPRSPTHPSEPTHNYETTFDLDGNVETASLSSSRDGNRLSQYDRQPRGTDPILPAVLEFLEETEETFLHAVITDVEPSAPQFKLAPTYTLYLSARYRASTHYRPELQPTERAHRLTVMLANVATMIQRVIQERYMDASSLAFWLANGSELLHMLKSDRHVGAFSTRAQDILAEAVHTAFGSLVRCVTLELTPAMTQFMADADEPAKEAGVLQIFSNTMALLRRCRVNAALTIQLFSHLFHAINATAFNTLVSNGNLCVRWFGRRLKARLNALETWAERQGLELASQCHLATIMQATHLLQAPKYNAEELATLSSTCFKLNSLQVRALLQKYQPAADEPRLPAELIENVVKVAESVADTLARADGREIRLEEEPVLGLALLLPEDGYSCEVIRGVPPGLAEFLAPLQRDGLCRMAAQPTSSGYWTIYMIDHNNLRSPSAMSNRSGGYISHTNQNQAQPEIHVIKLHKSTNGMGLSIVAAKGAGQDRLGIYIKSVVAGGAADADGRLTAGDQLLKVDGQSLVGITQEKAAEYLVRTGPIVTLEVAKQGAIYHGLATLLSQPSPVMSRAYKTRPKSELSEPAVEATETINQPATSHSMGNLLSFPKQAPCQELVQPGAIPSQYIFETPFYRNQIDRSFPRIDVDEYRSMQQDSLFRQRGAYSSVYSIDDREHVYCPSTPTVSPVRLSRPRMPCPLISITSDTEVSSVIYQDESDESDDKIIEEGDGSTEQGEAAMSNLNYSTNALNLFERTTTPLQEYAGITKDYKHSLLTEPLIVNRNLFDNIPYIDQTDDINFTISSKCVQTNPSNKCEHCIKAGCDNFNLKNSRNRTNVERNRQQTLNESSFELNTPNNPNFPLTSSFPTNESAFFIKDTTIGSDSVVESKSDNNLRFQDVDATKHSLNIDERYEDKLEDMSNSEDCADESSSTINDDCASSRIDRDTEEGISTPKMYTIMPELHLDLSGLNNDVSSDESKMEKCWKSPEEVRLGCGRVAALAKHFSKLGDAGLIKFKSTKLNGSRQFVSEPNIMTSRKTDEHLHHPCHTRKEYKSDSDLAREKDENSQLCSDERCNNAILVDVEADGDFKIEGCKFHHCGTKRVTIARIPMNNQTIDTEESNQAKDENHDKDIIKDQNRNESQKNMLTEKDNIKKSSSKLSFEQQRVIAEQLEQFSNLDNTDAPLFIPEQGMIKDSTVFKKNENNETSAVDDTIQLNLIKQLEAARREKLSLIDTDDNFKKMKKTCSLSSLPSIRSPSSFIMLSLSNLAKSSQSSEDIKSQIHRYCEKHPKCFIDISGVKNCSNDTSESSLTSHTNIYSRLGDNKYSVLRMRIARPLCNSENNLIGAAVYEKETERATDLHDKSTKLTRSCENILSSNFLSDFDDRTRSSENMCEKLDSSCKSYDKLISNPKESVRWHCHRSFEELKPKKGSRKRDNSINSITVHSTQTKFDKFYGDQSDFEDGEDMHWIHHLSLEELESKRESHEQDKCTNLERIADVQKSNWLLKKRLRMKRVSGDRLKDNSLKLSRKKAKDTERQKLRIEGKSQSDFDVSRRKSDSESYGWSFREISSLKDDDQSPLRPRRMSERDLPSRLGNDATLQQIHSSKSVPALHNMGTEAKQQHEVFNPGYSRASSSNSVTPPVQPPPMATINSATSLRSRSSHNLHDPMRIGTLPSTGLVSRQQSSPNLNPNTSHMNAPSNVQGTEAERFYQNLSIYRNQDSTVKQQISPQQSDDRNPQHIQKGSLKGSQNSLNRPSTMEVGSHFRDRPTSAYITQGQHQSYSAVSSQMQQHIGGPPPRSQSSRDIIRQEAKMQEMQEEVRRRELRGGAPLLNQHRPPMYNIGTRMTVPPAQQVPNLRSPRPLGTTSSLGTTSNYAARQNTPGYNYPDAQYAQYNSTQYGQYGQYNQYPNRYPVIGNQYGPMIMPKPKNELIARDHQPMPNENLLGRDSSSQETKSYAEQTRHFAGSQNNPHYPNGNLEHRVDQYGNDNVNRAQNGDGHSTEVPPTRPALPSEDTFNESPPPPPPSTSTHPLYKQTDTRYTASMQDPPRGSYYPVGGISAMQQPRQYQYSATNPWQREEKEKEQARRREAARQWRDQQIAELSALAHRTQQQEEQLRALQLERDFQKRAEEIANQDDDEESNDLDNESVQRVQGLLRMAASQDRTVQGALQPPILSRTITGNQSMRGGLPLLSSQSVASSHAHILPNQTTPQNVEMSSPGQENSGLHVQPNQQQQQQTMSQNEEHVLPANYGTHSHFSSGQKSYSLGMSHSVEDRELQRRMDEVKRKQAEYEENQKKQEEQQQQTYQSNQHPRSHLHPGMLRLDNLIINGPNVSISSQNIVNDAPPPPERGSSYAVMSQQSALRSNGSTTSNLPPTSQQLTSIKRVSFHDASANSESMLRNVSSATSNPPSISMDTIREDPNNFINDAENLLASPKTPDGSGTSFSGATPGVIGAQEVYKDPRQKRLAEKQKQQQNSQIGAVPEKLSFKEKMKMFAMETGEDGTPRDKVKISRAQREIDNISSPLNSNNNNNNNNTTTSGNNTNNNRT